MDLKTACQILKANKPQLTKKYKMKSLGIFGSYSRGEQKKGSDLDILVEYKETPGFFGLLEAEDHLGKLLGVKVDLVTKGSVTNPYISKSIRKEVVMV
ncbi:MAG: nucleotidyltransferase family protein [Deltaproteobacteria bacterium]